MRKLTLANYLEKAYHVHGDLYDYSKAVYNGLKSKIIIVCKEHGEFLQSPDNHLAGQKCPACMEQKFDLKTWIEKANNVHSFKYDYSKTIYKDSRSSVLIICLKHGKFEQRANDHLQGAGCSKCKIENLPQNQFKSQAQWIEEANEIHDNKFDYSKVIYKGWLEKVIIICPKHGEFEQQAGSHLQGFGCPVCKESQGEKKIRKYLDLNNIEYILQYKSNDCRHIRVLPFDFYLPAYNLLIEFDGIQHYKLVELFGGIPTFELIKLKDKIKTQYTIDNNIKLLRISYLEIDNIETILKSNL